VRKGVEMASVLGSQEVPRRQARSCSFFPRSRAFLSVSDGRSSFLAVCIRIRRGSGREALGRHTREAGGRALRARRRPWSVGCSPHTRSRLIRAVPPSPLPLVSRAFVSQCVDRLVSCLQPCLQSETRRYAIASYIIDCIKRCFQGGLRYSLPRRVEAFAFGSVPLKAYLPDGDLDISIFTETKLKDSWAYDLKSFLEAEMLAGEGSVGSGQGWSGKGRHGIQIQEVQIIQAEVKLVKCIVSGLEVDVSCNALGGLCAVAFLEWFDQRVGRNHLVKKSILLIKAWCYYESRLLGAHHGMLSSYALEVMVLFILNVHGSEMDTPLEVFHRFMQVFAEFDFDRYCLSILGPIELDSFPHPRLDALALPADHEPLLGAAELRDAISQYSTKSDEAACAIECLSHSLSCSREERPSFHMNRKHLNIMDPLMPTNNLGRSVSKTNSVRMRTAFGHGAKSLTHVFMYQEPAVASQRIALYFNNTWNSIHRVSFDNRSFSTSTGRLNPEYLFMNTSASQLLGAPQITSVPEADVANVGEEDSGGRIAPQLSSQSLVTSVGAGGGLEREKKPSSSKHRRTNSVTSTMSVGSMNTIGSTVLAMQVFNTGGGSSKMSSQASSLTSDMPELTANIEFARKCQEDAAFPWGLGERDRNSSFGNLDREISTVGPLPIFEKQQDGSSNTTYASIAAHGLTPRASRALSRRDSLSVNASVSVSPTTRSPMASAGIDGRRQTVFQRSDAERAAEIRSQERTQSEGVDAQSLSRKLQGVQLTWSSIAAQKPRPNEASGPARNLTQSAPVVKYPKK